MRKQSESSPSFGRAACAVACFDASLAYHLHDARNDSITAAADHTNPFPSSSSTHSKQAAATRRPEESTTRFLRSAKSRIAWQRMLTVLWQ